MCIRDRARRGLHGQQIGHGRDGEDDPADDVVPAFVAIHLSFGLSAKTAYARVGIFCFSGVARRIQVYNNCLQIYWKIECDTGFTGFAGADFPYRAKIMKDGRRTKL